MTGTGGVAFRMHHRRAGSCLIAACYLCSFVVDLRLKDVTLVVLCIHFVSVHTRSFVTLVALRDIRQGDEVCISYVDRMAPVTERRAVLRDHYEFECKCARCVKEHREQLRGRARARGATYLQNNSVLGRNSYVHDLAGGGSGSAGVARGSSSN